ncbi:MAG: formate dehydrogenase subunit alpha [Candidatus Heimdallarchaeum endolithica]|uniref:Formate dehydrogenase subunit alpha n=1 Tax=Candidatus Heimdallarchaeum endolithica TaxID=2876572 RepID=A0A9Y1BP23_9ARCH|nr:MAG: formate dehydrogenase subunit alpha [Candidatus Heimdallarchaeum endolithica]
MSEEKISIIVDGQKILCKKDDTYLSAITRAGIEIPTLCHMEELKPSGACRICVIEVEGAPNLVAACVTPVRPNAVVTTYNERIHRARQTNIELLLRSHPLNCIVCNKNGVCTLQKLAYQYVPKSRLSKLEGKKPTTDLAEVNEFFVLNYSACIRCQLCVRVADEIQVCNVLSMQDRGFDIYPSAGFGRSFEEAGCVACGNCVEVCPVGALVSKSIKTTKSRSYELKKTVTTCTYCGVGCQLEILVDPKQNKIVNVQSHRDSINGLSLCVKGRYGWNYVHHQDRINTPLIKKDGKFVESSWEEAFDLIEKQFKKIISESGPDSLAFLTSAKCTNEENYLMQKLSRAAIGTNNIDHCARLCHASTVTGLVKAFGSGAMTNSISDLTNDAEVIFIIGSNTTEAHPVIGTKIKQAVKNGKTKLIVADPRKIELSDYAEVYMSQRPGSDVALINAMIKYIIDEGLYDEAFIKQRTEDFEKLKENISKIDFSSLCKIANVEEEEVKKAASLYATAKTAAIIYAMGITQHTTGTDNVLSLANLAMITGNVGKPGTGVNPLRGQNNVQGACDLGGLPDVFPGYQKVTNEENIKKFKDFWGVDKLDNKEGLTVVEIMNEAHKGNIRGIYIMGENPVISDPNVNHVREALEKVEFLVVQDLFITETAKYADVILPGQSFAEKDGTYTNTERRVQRVRKAIETEGSRLPDWKILEIMLNRFGIEKHYNSPSEIMDEIAQVTPIYGGISYERLENRGLQWPCPSSDHPGTPILHKDKFSRGKGKFHTINYLDPDELPDDEYPLILTTGRNLFHFHTGEMTHRVAGIHQRKPIEKSEINVKDAKKLGIKTGDKVIIESRRGKVLTEVKVTDRIKEGVVFMTFHFKDSAANLLTNDALDPLSKIPELKVCAVKVTKK